MMILIQGCIKNDRESQRLLYKHYYAYAISICMRYARSKEEAQEILNDGFMKVFSKISLYSPNRSFTGWLRKILINTAIDHFRAAKKHYFHLDIATVQDPLVREEMADQISYNEILELVQKLSPMYRMVFSMFAIDGYNHEEIASKLGISVGTSKSNLYKARANLKKMLTKINKVPHEQLI